MINNRFLTLRYLNDDQNQQHSNFLMSTIHSTFCFHRHLKRLKLTASQAFHFIMIEPYAPSLLPLTARLDTALWHNVASPFVVRPDPHHTTLRQPW